MMLKFSDARTGSGSDDSIAVSPANVAMGVSCVNGTSAVKYRYKYKHKYKHEHEHKY